MLLHIRYFDSSHAFDMDIICDSQRSHCPFKTPMLPGVPIWERARYDMNINLIAWIVN